MKMEKQQSIADIEYANRKRKTKRDEFLGIMEEVIPWDEWTAVVEPYYPGGKRGRPPRGVETMLRMYLLANWFNLSDEGVEDAIYDSYAFRKFMQVDFLGEEQAPDATTLCKFRKLTPDIRGLQSDRKYSWMSTFPRSITARIPATGFVGRPRHPALIGTDP